MIDERIMKNTARAHKELVEKFGVEVYRVRNDIIESLVRGVEDPLVNREDIESVIEEHLDDMPSSVVTRKDLMAIAFCEGDSKRINDFYGTDKNWVKIDCDWYRKYSQPGVQQGNEVYFI